MIDNLTWLRGRHSLKAGIDAQFIADDRVRGDLFIYTFPNSAAYLAAKSGAESARLHHAAAAFGKLDASYNSGVLRVLRAGRLAGRRRS